MERVTPRTVLFEDARNNLHTVGESHVQVIGIQKWRGPFQNIEDVIGIKFWTTRNSTFKLGYFNSVHTRDLAYELIQKASDGVELTFNTFFYRHPIDEDKLRATLGGYDFGNILKSLIHKHKSKGLDFIKVSNSNEYSKIQLKPHHIKDILENKALPPEINKNELAKYFTLNATVPKSVEKKLRLSSFYFWRTVIQLYFR